MAFGILRQQEDKDRVATWEFALAGSSVGTDGTAGLLPCTTRVALQLHLLGTSHGTFGKQPMGLGMALALRWRNFFIFDKRPMAMPLLLGSIRAARRAVASDPDDSLAWLFLGEAYLALQTQESNFAETFALLGQLRQAQVSGALHQALRRQPELALAHMRLVEYYDHTKYDDLKLKHLRAYRQAVPGDRETAARTAREDQDLEDQVKVRSRRFDREMGRLRVLDRAQLALQLGLAGKALELLLASDYSAFGTDGANLELDLLLATGGARDVDEMVDPKKLGAFGPKRYQWLRAQVALALGNYDKLPTSPWPP